MTGTQHQVVFDLPHYQSLIQSREVFLRRVLPPLRDGLGLHIALDAGCGVGFFTAVLADLGMKVQAFDGRSENVEEARVRYPEREFHVADIEDPNLSSLGQFDLVLCFGVLYHLENPFRAIRNLHALTGKALLIESMCIPGSDSVLCFRDEGPTEDQGLRHIAFYPSELCLVKMLYRAGYSSVFRFLELPDHPDFRSSFLRRRMRTLLLASKSSIGVHFLMEIPEPRTVPDPWMTAATPALQFGRRIRIFLSKPLPEKLATVRRILARIRA